MKFIKILALLIVLLNYGCKKQHDGVDNPTGETFTPAYVPPSQPGILLASQTSLTIKVGQSAQLSGFVFNSNGNAISQPSLFWNADNLQVVSVSSGLVQGLAIGNAVVSITDGQHGIVYVSVTVVDVSTVVSSTGTDIVFFPPVLVLPKGGNGTFTYTVKNQIGQTVSVTPNFVSVSGITVTSSTINVGNSVGSFNVLAINGGDTLKGTLQVIVYDPQITQTDTTWKITRLINYPCSFSKNNLAAAPFRIEVTQTVSKSGGLIDVTKFQTSPDKVIIEDPSIVTIDANGCFKSLAPGCAKLSFTYKAETVFALSSVLFDLEGNWSGGPLHVCSDGNPAHIGYFNTFDQGFISAPEQVYYENCNNNVALSRNCDCLQLGGGGGYNTDGSFYFIGLEAIGAKKANSCGMSMPSLYFNNCNKSISGGSGSYIDKDKIKVNTSEGDVILVRGVGSCEGTNYITIEGAKYSITSDSITTISSDTDCFSYYTSATSQSPTEVFTNFTVYKPIGTVSSGEFGNTVRTLSDATDCSSVSLCYLAIYTSGASYGSSNGSIQIDSTNANYLIFSGGFTKYVNGNDVGVKQLSGKIRRYKQ
jgi:hypothetical protein